MGIISGDLFNALLCVVIGAFAVAEALVRSAL